MNEAVFDEHVDAGDEENPNAWIEGEGAILHLCASFSLSTGRRVHSADSRQVLFSSSALAVLPLVPTRFPYCDNC